MTKVIFRNATGITGSLPVQWEESDIGIQRAFCPCGNVSEVLNLIITRECRGDFITQSVWGEPDNTACNNLSLTICRISEVRIIK